MVRRQTFDDFLNSPGPSTPRGRGRGRGRGSGGGGARGGRGGGGGYGATPRSSFNTDYTSVPLDYSKINSKKYTKLDGFDVAPFGPDSNRSEQQSSPYTPRGRGRGRGRGGLGESRLAHESSNTQTPSGARTPVTGSGYHGHGHSFPPDIAGTIRGGIGGARGGRGGKRHTMGDTVGKSGVMWGGGYAPIFVKAGESFKDGEVDVIKFDADTGEITVDIEHLDDAAVPQMEDPRDDFEVEITGLPEVAHGVISPLPDVAVWTPERGPAGPVDQMEAGETSMTSDAESAKGFSETLVVEDDLSQGPSEEGVEEDEEDEEEEEGGQDGEALSEAEVMEVEEVFVQEEDGTDPDAESVEADDDPFFIDVQGSSQHDQSGDPEDPLFFVDVQPVHGVVVEETSITYETSHPSIPLGRAPSRSPSPQVEEIVFRPRKYEQPKPISVNVPPPTIASTSSRPGPAEESARPDFASPTSLNRRQKKASKREKRARNKGKAREKNRKRSQAYEGSDSDWGSDGPPAGISDIEGSEDDDGAENDEEILRDYLKGTISGFNARDVGAGDENSESGSDSDEDIARAYDASASVGDEALESESGEEDNPDIEGSSGSDDDNEDEDEDDDNDDDESSELGEIEFEWQAEADDNDSEDEEDDEGDLFKGKDDWNDTEWFIKNLEDASDGETDMKDRKSRRALFSSIENGDFGDDWGTVPVKRNKKGSGIPSESQGQWEKDRQRKAEKKRQRDLDRSADLSDPYPATHGKKKGKSKGSSRIEQAKLAHSIPESASRVAESFDIPSDFDEPQGSSSRFSGRLAALSPGGRGFASIDAGIRSFIADDGKTTYSVPPMDKEGRKKVHMLAECYGSSSKSRGKGKARFTVLTKTMRTGKNLNEDKIARLVNAAPFSGGLFYKALYAKQKKDKKDSKKGPGDRGSSARMRDGEAVGEGAERIGIDNIGHQSSSRMGWAEGSRIGRSEGGSENPVVAIVKSTKAGLGA